LQLGISALEQLFDHGEVAGQYHADGDTAGDQVRVNKPWAHKLHGCLLLKERSDSAQIHGVPLFLAG
jgi:hypothetical protein